jgi:hypothetical protein
MKIEKLACLEEVKLTLRSSRDMGQKENFCIFSCDPLGGSIPSVSWTPLITQVILT